MDYVYFGSFETMWGRLEKPQKKAAVLNKYSKSLKKEVLSDKFLLMSR